MRLALILCLVCVTVLAVPAADARGVDSSQVGRKLLERGAELLRRAEYHYFRRDTAAAARDGREAARIFETVLHQEPRNHHAALLGGLASTLAGDREGAGEWVRRYQRLSPRGEIDPELHYLVAFVQLIGDKRPDRAIRSLTRMFSLDPRMRPVARDNLWFLALSDFGRDLLAAGKHDEAIVQFRAGARIGRRMGRRDKEYMMLANVGVALMQSDRYIEATEVFAGLARNDKNNPLWHYRLGLCHAAQTQFAEAVPVYRQVVRLLKEGHSYPEWAEEMGQVELRLGNCLRHLAENQVEAKRRTQLMSEAESLLRGYIVKAPKDPVGYKWLAVMLFENLDKPYEALPHFKKAFELDPMCEAPLRYMIQIHRNFPPPEGVSAQAWMAPVTGWSKDLEENAAKRKQVQEERKDRNGSDGCD